jgi:Asp-tRNA(Asn)/Glu-tRNA(Gln) amidotransferase A subunit family amidase
VPTIVKDNFETIGLQSAAGSLALKGFISAKDAFQVKQIRAAGAIVLAKSNMAEFAFSPLETVSSLKGTTKNPYALDRVPAGSSGGTAAAVAASFGAVGLGSDTGNSIRGPSAHTALAGIRSTMGLTSRGGVIPLSYLADIAGPMARTVEDMTRVFQVIVGEDPGDPMTARSRGRARPDYLKSLVRDGLKGARIGVLRQAITGTLDDEVAEVFTKALADLKAGGAEIIDPVEVDISSARRRQGVGSCRGFKYDIQDYLAQHGDRVPVKTLDQILAHPDFAKFPPTVQQRLRGQQDASMNGPDTEACKADAEYRAAYGAAVTKTMDDLRLDALVYPTWSQPPQLIGQVNQREAGDNSQRFSPMSGFPAVNVPMGYTRNGTLPAGLTIYGRAWSEATLIKLAYAYEQATKHRRPPPIR